MANDMSNEAKTVLDFFAGTGSVLLVAEKKKMASYNIEINPRYCDLIIARYYNYCIINNKECKITINDTILNNKKLEKLINQDDKKNEKNT